MSEKESEPSGAELVSRVHACTAVGHHQRSTSGSTGKSQGKKQVNLFFLSPFPGFNTKY